MRQAIFLFISGLCVLYKPANEGFCQQNCPMRVLYRFLNHIFLIGCQQLQDYNGSWTSCMGLDDI